MHSESYIDIRRIAFFEAGTVAALAPYLSEQKLQADLVALACDQSGPIHLSVRPLDELATTPGCEQFETELRPLNADALWLVGIADDLTAVPAAIAGMLDALDWLGLNHTCRYLAITTDGHSWGYAEDHIDEVDAAKLNAVPPLDSTAGRLAALSVHARCTQYLGVTALRGDRTEHEIEEAVATENLVASLRARTASQTDLRQSDRRSLIGCLDSPGPITAAEALNLALALADSRELMAEAVERILTAETAEATRLDLWCQITRDTVGPTRACAAALAALAAWRYGDPLALGACNEALRADRQQPLARLVSDLLATGIPSSTMLDGMSSVQPERAEPGTSSSDGSGAS